MEHFILHTTCAGYEFAYVWQHGLDGESKIHALLIRHWEEGWLTLDETINLNRRVFYKGLITERRQRLAKGRQR